MPLEDFTSRGRVTALVRPGEYLAGAALSAVELDTKGWRYLHLMFALGDIGNAGIGSAQLQGAASSGGSFADITGAVFFWRSGAMAANKAMHGFVDLQQQPRFVKISGANGAGGASDIAIVGTLYAGKHPSFQIDFTEGGADELTFDIRT
jgi:hypothetical protein